MYGLYQILYYTIIDIYNTMKSPFFIAVIAIIYLQYYKIGKLEKEVLEKSRSALLKTIISAVFGVFGGIIVTIIFIYLGVAVDPKEFMYILISAIILSLINPRYMCFAYAGGLLSLSSILFNYPKIDVRQIMAIVAVLHMIESILVFFDGNSSNLPTYYNKGELIGGFNMNRFWPIPFVIFIGDDLIRPITLMAIISYGDFTVSSYPRNKTIKTSILLFIYSTILLSLAIKLESGIIPAIFAIVGHEFIVLLNQYGEKRRPPLFTTPAKGSRILGVKPRSVGKTLGLKTGDILISVNEIRIWNNRDLHDLTYLNPKEFRIKYFSHKTGIRHKVYRGKRKALGLVLLPRVLD